MGPKDKTVLILSDMLLFSEKQISIRSSPANYIDQHFKKIYEIETDVLKMCINHVSGTMAAISP